MRGCGDILSPRLTLDTQYVLGLLGGNRFWDGVISADFLERQISLAADCVLRFASKRWPCFSVIGLVCVRDSIREAT